MRKQVVFVFVCVLAAVAAAPAALDAVSLVRYASEPYDSYSGRYSYSYALTDGTVNEQKAEIKNQGTDHEYLSVIGAYSWLAPNGVRYIVRYTADEDGYQPEVEEEPPGTQFEIVNALIG